MPRFTENRVPSRLSPARRMDRLARRHHNASCRSPAILTTNALAGTNFAAAVAPLIGRSLALQTLQALVSTYRIVTPTEPGGIGKTVLALDLARRVSGEFTGGGWLVELAS